MSTVQLASSAELSVGSFGLVTKHKAHQVLGIAFQKDFDLRGREVAKSWTRQELTDPGKDHPGRLVEV